MSLSYKSAVKIFISRAVLLSAAFLLAAEWSFCQSSLYEPRGKRDPFVPLVGSDRPSVIKLKDVVSVDDVRLEGVASGPGGKKMAIINGELVKENDKIGDVVVHVIQNKSVALIISGKEYEINFPQEGGQKG